MRLSEASSESVMFSTIGAELDPDIVATFTIEAEPVTKSRARFARRGDKVISYTPAKVVDAEAAVAAAYLKAAGRLNTNDTETTFGVVAVFFASNNNRRDVDNMLKLILDGLNKVAWADDSQVTEVVGRKVSAYPLKEPRTEVAIYRTGVVQPHQSTCERCGALFPARKSQKHCSTECSYAARNTQVACTHCGKEFMRATSLARRGNNYCSSECKTAYWREQRKSPAKGTCQDCGGPTTKESYARCAACNYANGGKWATQ